MSPRHGYHDEERIDEWIAFFADSYEKITDLELATLKGHVVTEGALRILLAYRLDVSENTLSTRLKKAAGHVSFSLILELALAGLGESHLLGGLRKLNAARNSLAHVFEGGDQILHGYLASFVNEIGKRENKNIDWPPTLSEQLRVLGEALTSAGGAILALAGY